MLATQPPPTHTVPGYQFVNCDAREPYREVWTARDPNGELWRVQFVRGFESLGAPDLADSLHRLQRPQHPALVRPDVLLEDEGRVVLGSELVSRSLAWRFETCKTA